MHPILISALSVLILQACGGGGGSTQEPGVNGSYLHVSVPNFYFGNEKVGSTSTQNIQIANRGADVYPINSIAISGKNAEEFKTDVIENVVLNPAEAITVGITFQPITEGAKVANLVVDYQTIQKVPETANLNEQKFYQAQNLEKAGNYTRAKRLYNDYIDGQPVTSNKRRAAIKIPVISEAAIYGEGEDLDRYLAAIDQRDVGDLQGANYQLNMILTMYPDSYLADDALYLQGYMQLIDELNPKAALKTMQKLRTDYPDTSYYDTSLYSEAIAQQSIGNLSIAKQMLEDLRERHTGAMAFGIPLAKDNLVSRMWFERAETALKLLTSI